MFTAKEQAHADTATQTQPELAKVGIEQQANNQAEGVPGSAQTTIRMTAIAPSAVSVCCKVVLFMGNAPKKARIWDGCGQTAKEGQQERLV